LTQLQLINIGAPQLAGCKMSCFSMVRCLRVTTSRAIVDCLHSLSSPALVRRRTATYHRPAQGTWCIPDILICRRRHSVLYVPTFCQHACTSGLVRAGVNSSKIGLVRVSL